ncbi:AAA family ATPase [Pseudooceanicola sp. CBS1P-1]|uniref:AAA family ATPase n=1 Tax=Pseudooceanicola albus TaxID=2692189 RepID=A0A6L7G5F9_9RHOB|nr:MULTISPECIES: AAA family ATPase [Pseudooceanicola]MBT9385985.1 AAA family ATPase [Pseudooceanicola endophyticus]MXN19594.1 AAA family ATPase [Pseudooceanicola albus]
MRILAIRGGNLASLSAVFEIDLAAEPLRSAGLFAITGETGAGKSTILDALCLALYGRCPRLSNDGVDDDVPDIEGQTIRATDARSILRRGTSSGFAEVDFEATDGQLYRAGWAARRARGRAEGRLQSDERSLTRLSDGQVLESQKTAVTKRVEALSGLTYEEFRRTCLLAQGDFDAFLRARTQERAALLEKVTGTGIYRDISRRIYERHEAARQALAALETRRAATPALPPEARQALEAEAATLHEEIAALGPLLAETGAALARHAARTQAEARVAAAEAALAEAGTAEAAATPERDRLARLEAAAPLRPAHDARRHAAEAVQELEQRAAAAGAQLSDLAAALAGARDRRAEASRRQGAAEALFKTLGPVWTRATQLDERLRAAAQDLAQLSEGRQQARAALAQAQEAHAALLRRAGTAEAARDTARAALETRPGSARLAEQWPAIAEALETRNAARAQGRAARDRAATLRQQAEAAETRRQSLQAEEEADGQTLSAAEAELARDRSARDALLAGDPQARHDRLTRAGTLLDAARRALRTHHEATGTRDEARARADTARTDATRHREAADRAARAGAEAAIRINALEAPVDRAEAAASELAARLRRHLSAGEPCPVCGALSHPVQADDALTGLAREMRAALTEARATRDAQARAEAQALSAAEAARLSAEAATSAANTAEATRDEAAATLADTDHRGRQLGLPPLPSPEAPGAQTALDALGADTTTQLAEAGAQLARLETLRGAIDATRDRIAALGQTRAARAATRETLSTGIAEARATAAGCDADATGADARAQRAEAILHPVLAGLGLPQDALGSGDLDRQLGALHDWHRDQAAALSGAEATLADLAPRIAGAARDLAAAQQALDQLSTRLSEAGTRAEALRQDRDGLLEGPDGADTAAHRSRHNADRIAAGEAATAAAEALAATEARQAALLDRQAQASEALGPARTRAAQAGARLAADCAAAGIAPEALAPLLAEGPRAIPELRQALAALAEARTSAAATLAARREDLEQIRAQPLPEEPEETLQARRAEAEARRDAAHSRTGAIREQLEADDRLLGGLRALDAEIAEARSQQETWAAVNAAVGSANGGKFAQIAQGVTLSLLVERANLHLAELKPRYRLIQGAEELSLHIVDRDMGEETRSTRSLSGGERFLVSLALALALSRMGSTAQLAATLFIDEGFGSLDAESLDVAVDALEALQAQGRTIGVISHVEALKDRIPVQIRVSRHGGGASTLALSAPGL